LEPQTGLRGDELERKGETGFTGTFPRDWGVNIEGGDMRTWNKSK